MEGKADMNLQERQNTHVLQWHITHKCNLRCKHCYQDDYEQEAQWDDLMATLDKYERYLQEKNLRGQINLTGGEPLASEHFFPLIEEIVKRGIKFAVLTNGTMLNQIKAARLAKYCPVFVQVSIDGSVPTHDKIRGKGAAAEALRGIDYLKEFGTKVLVSFTAQRCNWK